MTISEDENVWACLFGMIASGVYREGLEQMVVQRFLAARNIGDARR